MNKLSFLYGLGAGILIASIIFYSALSINTRYSTETNNSEETQNLETDELEEKNKTEDDSETEAIPNDAKGEQNSQNTDGTSNIKNENSNYN